MAVSCRWQSFLYHTPNPSVPNKTGVEEQNAKYSNDGMLKVSPQPTPGNTSSRNVKGSVNIISRIRSKQADPINRNRCPFRSKDFLNGEGAPATRPGKISILFNSCQYIASIIIDSVAFPIPLIIWGSMFCAKSPNNWGEAERDKSTRKRAIA